MNQNIRNILKNIICKRDPLLAELVVNWDVIVEKDFASQSHPFRISRYNFSEKSENTLYIKTANSATATYMHYQAEAIIERIAVYVGGKVIHQLRFIV